MAITLRRERHDVIPNNELTWPCISPSTTPPLPSVDSLPHNCAVVTITVTDDLATMFVSRQQRDREPLVFCLPLDRQSRRDGDEAFTFETATAELREIIQASDNAAQTAKTVSSREGKAAWWAERHALDKGLEELLATIEFCWLGAFKVSHSAYEAYKRLSSTAHPQLQLRWMTSNDESRPSLGACSDASAKSNSTSSALRPSHLDAGVRS